MLHAEIVGQIQAPPAQTSPFEARKGGVILEADATGDRPFSDARETHENIDHSVEVRFGLVIRDPIVGWHERAGGNRVLNLNESTLFALAQRNRIELVGITR